MELETLKTLWKEQDPLPGVEMSRDQLLALSQQRSRGPIDRMRRNVRKEALLMVISYVPCIILYLLAFSGRMSGISWLMAGLLLFFFAYYYRKNQLLKKMQCNTCEVRSNLSGQLKTLRKYVRFYFWASTLIIPVMMFFSFGIAFQSRMASGAPFNLVRGIILLLIVTGALTVAVYFKNRWYINKLYGRHMLKLQNLLREMDEA